ncbi:hypothetical protein HID58_091297 [Brassica napus]|uniref:Uncharacterized protein n=1 Tax=Brassica napus TaxID=3708 RepID=A0ABQ7X2U4_BRANA|nr:hypothetical protein HID58_091297 [Brassica napus]
MQFLLIKDRDWQYLWRGLTEYEPARQTLLHSHSKMGRERISDNRRIHNFQNIKPTIETTKRYSITTLESLKPFKGNYSDNQTKLVETRQSSYSGGVPAFDARKNIYSPVEFQEDRFELFANLPMPSCNILIKCGDLREKLPVEED